MLCESLRLSQHLIIRTAGVRSAQLRDNAVGAAVVAALSNFQISHIARSRQHTRQSLDIFAFELFQMLQALACHNLVDNPADISKAVRTNNGINLRQAFKQLVSIALAQAASHNQIFAAALRLIFAHLQHSIDGFFLCAFNKAAGVDNNQISFRRIIRNLQLFITDNAQHNLGINKILRTAKADHAYFHTFSSNSIY